MQESPGDLTKPRARLLLERTGSTLDISTAQTQCGDPPPGSVRPGMQPRTGTDVSVGKIPRDFNEEELVPLFERLVTFEASIL